LVIGYMRRMQTKRIQIPDEVGVETDTYRRHSDMMGEFLEDYCFVDDRNAEITKKELYEKYSSFAKEAGHTSISTAKGFSMKLLERSDIPYLGERKSGSTRYWTGIRLRDDSDNVQEEAF